MAENTATDSLGADESGKLRDIDVEIRELHRRAINAGLSRTEIYRAAAPLLQLASHAALPVRPPSRGIDGGGGGCMRRRTWTVLTLLSAVTVALVACLISTESTYRWLCAHARILSIKTLPYWDWTKYYNEECIVRNPFYQEIYEQLFDEDCQACENIAVLERASNVSHIVMAESYIKRDVPVIITDATDSWPARELFNLQFLIELYETEQVLRSTPPCHFTSSVRQRSISVQSLLAAVYSGQLTQWYAHWENCERKTVRLMRRFYRRPNFLPPMVEAVDRSWMFMSSGFSSHIYKHVEMASPLMWIAQLQGENKVRLTPKFPCNETCSTQYAVLRAGDTVVWTDFLWTLDYIPAAAGDRLNVAVGSAGTFD